MQKKLFCVLIIYCTFFLLPLIGLQFHLDLLVLIPDVFPFTSYSNLTVTVANCYHIKFNSWVDGGSKGVLKDLSHHWFRRVSKLDWLC